MRYIGHPDECLDTTTPRERTHTFRSHRDPYRVVAIWSIDVSRAGIAYSWCVLNRGVTADPPTESEIAELGCERVVPRRKRVPR